MEKSAVFNHETKNTASTSSTMPLLSVRSPRDDDNASFTLRPLQATCGSEITESELTSVEDEQNSEAASIKYPDAFGYSFTAVESLDTTSPWVVVDANDRSANLMASMEDEGMHAASKFQATRLLLLMMLHQNISKRRDSETSNSNDCTMVQDALQKQLQESSSVFVNNQDMLEYDMEVLRSQRDSAQREAELQAKRCKQALKMAEEYEAERNEEIRRCTDAAQEVRIAKQQVLENSRKCNELLAALGEASKTVEVLSNENEVYRQNAAAKARKHQETQAALEASKRRAEFCAKEADEARMQAAVEAKKCDEALQRFNNSRREMENLIKDLQAQVENLKEALDSENKLREGAEEKLLQEAVTRQGAVNAALQKSRQRYREYTFEELQVATENFHDRNKLGEGGYGSVYKGKLHHTMVAVKLLNPQGLQGRKQFLREVELLSVIHHPHMVILLGVCPQRSCIVYEYMANGSLEDRLVCKNNSPPLPWYFRFRICFEVATALMFLHSGPEPIVHRDLKPGNILLDHNFVSKISDVGIARLLSSSLTSCSTMDSRLAGTFAYMDPEYQRTGVSTPQADIYALGIVMLQLLTGKPAVGVVSLVERAVDSGQLENVLDKSAGDWPLAEAMGLACLSLQCIEHHPQYRPDLGTKLLGALENLRAVADAALANMACVGQSRLNGELSTPNFFLCPISQEIMEDPHLAADGFTYEYEAIKAWLDGHDTSPMTNLRLSNRNLLPNYSLKSAIKDWQEKNQFTRRLNEYS